MREYVTLQCRDCKSQNYRTSKGSKGTKKLELKKHCPKCRKHSVHVERRK
jgi:large subunit ribosomal protein L33